MTEIRQSVFELRRERKEKVRVIGWSIVGLHLQPRISTGFVIHCAVAYVSEGYLRSA